MEDNFLGWLGERGTLIHDTPIKGRAFSSNLVYLRWFYWASDMWSSQPNNGTGMEYVIVLLLQFTKFKREIFDNHFEGK